MDDEQTEAALSGAAEALGGVHIGVNTAGGGIAKRTLTKEGPHPLADFRRVIELNLIVTVQHQPARSPSTCRRTSPRTASAA